MSDDGHAAQVRRRTDVTVTARITRACTICGGPRNADDPAAPCAGCGNRAPAVVDDVGVVAASYATRRRRLWWAVFGQPAAVFRSAAVNARNNNRLRS